MKCKRLPLNKIIAIFMMVLICFSPLFQGLPVIEAQAETTLATSEGTESGETSHLEPYEPSAEAYYDGENIVVVDVYARGNVQAYDIGIGYDMEEVIYEDSKIASDYLRQCGGDIHIELINNRIDDERIGSYCYVTGVALDDNAKNYDGLFASFKFHVTNSSPKFKLYMDTAGTPELITPEIPINQDICFEIKPDDTITVSGGIEIPQNVYIPDRIWDMPVTEIADSAFFDFAMGSQLEEIRLPNELKRIGDGAFAGCSSLTSIEIPDSVTSIGNAAFELCSSLTSIEIPDGVTDIGVLAFSMCSSLINIVIPDSVTSIGSGAFSSCDSLTSIKIPDSVTDIGETAFSGCSNLTDINIPDSVTTIENGMFSYCRSLTDINIPNSVTDIEDYAFSDCSSLTSIEIPDSVMSIGEMAFEYCSSLTGINVDLNNSVYASDEGVLYDKVLRTLIACPDGKEGDYIIPDSVTSIGDNAFSNCYNLTCIEISDSVTSIGDYAFSNCIGLTSIEIPDNVTNIGKDAFQHCNGLSNIKLSKNIMRIEEGTFSSCISLSNIEIPDSVISIGNMAFGWITELKNVKIYARNAVIDDETFFGCDNLNIQCYPGSTAEQFAISHNIPYGLLKDDEPDITPEPDAFEISGTTDHMASIDSYTGTETDIVIPDEINGYKPTEISAGAFKDSPVTSIVLPETVTKIGAGAFAGSDLKRITITANEIEIAEDAFDGCKDVIVCCYSGSKAYAFAQAHNIAVELLDAKPDIIYGDLDNSGGVDAKDALIILKIAAQLQTPTEEQKIAGDVNNSGYVDAKDALDVLKKAAQLIDQFLAEEN